MPNILITDNINPAAVAILQGFCDVAYYKDLSHEELLAKIPDFDGLMIRSASTVSADVIAAGQQLKIVGRAGVGTDNIDLPQATQRGIVVVNSPEGNTIAASEHTVGLLFALARHIPEGDALLKQGQWKRSALTGVELFGKTLGIIGLGKIGSRVAKTCRTVGMKVIVSDPFLSQAMAEELGVTIVNLETLFAQSDFITIHAPKTRETTHLLNRETLAKCKPGVRIVNCARGGIIDEQALMEAIQAGHVAGVALDVFEQEPLPADTSLLSLGHRAVLTPHLGASTEEAQINVALDVAEQIRDFFQSGYARNAVNIPLLRKDTLDPVRHYMPLAEALGSLVRQLADGAADTVEITARGTLAKENTSPLTLAVLKGLFATAREGVNYVNAPLIAEENGIQVKQSSTQSVSTYLNLLEVTLKTQTGSYRVAGTLLADDLFRIVEIDGYRTTLEATPHILFAPHHDRPGMLAQVATVLGQQGINISALQLARRGAVGGESVMIFNLDNPLDDTTLQAICQQEGIYDAIYIRF